MPRALLGLQVVAVEGRRRALERARCRHAHLFALEQAHLVGIVGEQLEGGLDREHPTHRRDFVVAPLIGRQAQSIVRLESREALAARLHEHAIARFRGQAGTAPLLHQVEEHPPALARNRLQRCVQLFGAVAVAGAKGLARHTGRVDAREQRIRSRNGATRQRDRQIARRQVAEHPNAELAVERLQGLLGNAQQRPVQLECAIDPHSWPADSAPACAPECGPRPDPGSNFWPFITSK